MCSVSLSWSIFFTGQDREPKTKASTSLKKGIREGEIVNRICRTMPDLLLGGAVHTAALCCPAERMCALSQPPPSAPLSSRVWTLLQGRGAGAAVLRMRCR